MKTLGIIVARGGSKGIPGKNLKKVKDKSLIEWVVTAANSSKKIDKLILSTDDQKIIDHCQNLSIEVPFTRPEHFATDEARSVDVVIHALQFFKDKNEEFDYVVLLQPTSPLLEGSDIDQGMELALSHDADSVITVFSGDHYHPALMYNLSEQNEASWFLPEEDKMARRQEMKDVYIRSGLFYIARAKIIEEKQSFYGDKVFAYKVPFSKSICIDEESDLELVEFFLERKMEGK